VGLRDPSLSTVNYAKAFDGDRNFSFLKRCVARLHPWSLWIAIDSALQGKLDIRVACHYGRLAALISLVTIQNNPRIEYPRMISAFRFQEIEGSVIVVSQIKFY